MGNFSAAANFLEKNNPYFSQRFAVDKCLEERETMHFLKEDTLFFLKKRNFFGKTLIRKISEYLSTFPFNGNGAEAKKIMAEDEEKKLSHFFKTSFERTVKSKFPHLIRKEICAFSYDNELINLDSIFNSSVFKEIKEKKSNTPLKMEENILHLLVISYTFRQFDIYTKIRKSYQDFQLSLKERYSTILTLCVDYGEFKLMQFIATEGGATIIQNLDELVPRILKAGDLEMLTLAVHYRTSPISKSSYGDDFGIFYNASAFYPLQSMELIEKIIIHEISPKEKEQYFLKILFLHRRNLQKFLKQWDSETRSYPKLKKKRSQQLLKLIVVLIVNYSRMRINQLTVENIIIEVIDSSYDLTETYHDDERHSEITSFFQYTNNTLLQIVTLHGLTDVLKHLIEKDTSSCQEFYHTLAGMDPLGKNPHIGKSKAVGKSKALEESFRCYHIGARRDPYPHIEKSKAVLEEYFNPQSSLEFRTYR